VTKPLEHSFVTKDGVEEPVGKQLQITREITREKQRNKRCRIYCKDALGISKKQQIDPDKPIRTGSHALVFGTWKAATNSEEPTEDKQNAILTESTLRHQREDPTISVASRVTSSALLP